MSATKSQIINGIAAYIEEELLPKMGGDKGLQIGLSVAVNAIKANNLLIERVMGNETVKAILQEDGAGNYEIGPVMDVMERAVKQYGALPLNVPPIPLLVPHGATIKLDAADIAAIRDKIEGGNQ